MPSKSMGLPWCCTERHSRDPGQRCSCDARLRREDGPPSWESSRLKHDMASRLERCWYSTTRHDMQIGGARSGRCAGAYVGHQVSWCTQVYMTPVDGFGMHQQTEDSSQAWLRRGRRRGDPLGVLQSGAIERDGGIGRCGAREEVLYSQELSKCCK